MIGLVSILFLFSVFLGAVGPGITGIALVLAILKGIQSNHTGGMFFVSLIFCLIPLSSYLAAKFTQSWINQFNIRVGDHLAQLAAVAAVWFLLSKIGIEVALVSALDISNNLSIAKMTSWISIVGANCLFCAAIAALVVASIGCLIEIPFHLVLRGFGIDARLQFSALRQIIVVFAVVCILDLFGVLLSRELAPATLISRLVN